MNELDYKQRPLQEMALFAGAGGGVLGGHLLGWQTAVAVEWGEYPASILAARQNDGVLPTFPIWSDIRSFDGRPFRGVIDVVSGGFPCQDISPANKFAAGIEGGRSSMWFEMLRVINEVQPEYAFIENSQHLRTRGLVSVLQGLAEAGYNAAWGVLSAEDCGANHERKRIWILARRAATYTNVSQRTRGGYPAEGRRDSQTLGWRLGGKPNPVYVEWMMGWPLGWTDLKPLEMDKFQSWLQQHSRNS